MARLGRSAYNRRASRNTRMLAAIGDRDLSQEHRDREEARRRQATEAWRGFV